MSNYTYLFLGILYVTIVPGFVFVEYFLSKLETWKKIPLYILFSILISTYFTFVTSLLFGFSRTTLMLDLLIFIILAIPLFKRVKLNVNTSKDHLSSYVVSVVVYLLFFIVLNAGIFREYQNYYVMSGPNWQDTAMHLSVIESISEGNFPPQAPYFSGQNLSYYYFSDLHAAIVNKFYGDFFPWILVLLNPLYASLFYLSVYTLSYSFLKNKYFSIFAGVGALLYGNLGFVNLIKDVLITKANYFSLLQNNAYHLDFDNALQMVPMADYFLQNRPMMIGLPAVVIIVFLLIEGIRNKKMTILFIMAGLINAALIKFQFFGFIVGSLFFGIFMTFQLISRKIGFKELISKTLAFILPAVLLLLIFGFGKAGERNLYQVVIESFSWGAWQEHNFFWFIEFIILNFNLPIFIFFLIGIFLLRFKIKNLIYIYLTTLILFLIPFTIKFTIYDYDMFKFFYYCIPFIYIIMTFFFFELYKINKTSLIIPIIILVFSSWTSVNMIIHAYLNKTEAYSISEYNVGMWIRKNTPQKSVFLTSPTVHCPVTDIAGRLRVISYINWPHSHGFNTGSDNVFSRVEDLRSFYTGTITNAEAEDILLKYDIDYIYLGSNEISDFPEAENRLESNKQLEKIYDEEDIKIFKKL